MGELAKWRAQNWVRISSSGKIAGKCGTSKNKKNPDRCYLCPKQIFIYFTKSSYCQKEKGRWCKGKQFVSNTPAGIIKDKEKEINAIQ